jgi:hypothetical protein
VTGARSSDRLTCAPAGKLTRQARRVGVRRTGQTSPKETNMREVIYSDSIGSRGRRPWLLLVRGDEVRAFDGADIPGWCAVAHSQYTRNGKWSGTTFTLAIADGVTALPGRNGWEEGTFREGLGAQSWLDCANKLGVSVPAAQAFLRAWRPKAADWYDSAAERLAAIDDIADGGANTITISFGSPTRRMRDEGFWDWPVVVSSSVGEIARFIPDQYRVEGTRVGDCIVQQHIHSSGHGGGYVSLTLVVPDGATAQHCRPE